MKRYLALDYGEKRVGVAVSDPLGMMAHGKETIQVKSEKQLLMAIEALLQEYDIARIVLGLPLKLSGEESEKSQIVRQFGEKLLAAFGIPVDYLDERLTSVQVHGILHQMGKKPSRHKARVDQMSAQLILQTYLDRETKRGI
ncbi:MAG: Holliday junction resolvase RuvX [Calditrichia bacterium]